MLQFPDESQSVKPPRETGFCLRPTSTARRDASPDVATSLPRTCGCREPRPAPPAAELLLAPGVPVPKVAAIRRHADIPDDAHGLRGAGGVAVGGLG
jgi:hypothetical protein